MQHRIGDWIQTYTGRQVWPLDLRPEDVCIEDIAHHLSLQCRFSGACRTFYSVAEHSTHVAYWVDCCVTSRANPDGWTNVIHKPLLLRALLHDASEAYLQDVVRPVKRHVSMSFYREAEERAMRAICTAFGVPIEEDEIIKRADASVLLAEKRDLLLPAPAPWTEAQGRDAEVYPYCIIPCSAAKAEDMFLNGFAAFKSTGLIRRLPQSNEASLAQYPFTR